MSHFTVLVIGDNVEKKLAPYDENTEVDPYPEKCYCVGNEARTRSFETVEAEYFLKFPILYDILDKLKEEYEVEKAKAELSSDEKEEVRFEFLHHEPNFMSAFRKFCQGSDKNGKDEGEKLWQEHHQRREEIFETDPSKEDPKPDCEECHGTGTRESTYNPKSKWDWYQIGGRWFGSFMLKEGKKPEAIGEPSWQVNAFEADEIISNNLTDQAKFGDIDWKGMIKASLKERAAKWDRIMNDESLDESSKCFMLSNKPLSADKLPTKKEFVNRGKESFGTYAVVTEDGEWHEPGKMGFWAMSSATEEEEKDWYKKFWDRFMKDLSPDTLITLVDCHI